jgi:FO synthase
VIVQNFRVKEDIAMRHRDEPSVFEMLRTIATARLILGPQMNIQAPPNLTPDAHGMYLLAGINDWGGISPVTRDHINPERPWPNLLELKEMCTDAGFELRERLGLYRVRARGCRIQGSSGRRARADLAARGQRRTQ